MCVLQKRICENTFFSPNEQTNLGINIHIYGTLTILRIRWFYSSDYLVFTAIPVKMYIHIFHSKSYGTITLDPSA